MPITIRLGQLPIRRLSALGCGEERHVASPSATDEISRDDAPVVFWIASQIRCGCTANWGSDPRMGAQLALARRSGFQSGFMRACPSKRRYFSRGVLPNDCNGSRILASFRQNPKQQPKIVSSHIVSSGNLPDSPVSPGGGAPLVAVELDQVREKAPHGFARAVRLQRRHRCRGVFQGRPSGSRAVIICHQMSMAISHRISSSAERLGCLEASERGDAVDQGQSDAPDTGKARITNNPSRLRRKRDHAGHPA